MNARQLRSRQCGLRSSRWRDQAFHPRSLSLRRWSEGSTQAVCRPARLSEGPGGWSNLCRRTGHSPHRRPWRSSPRHGRRATSHTSFRRNAQPQSLEERQISPRQERWRAATSTRPSRLSSQRMSQIRFLHKQDREDWNMLAKRNLSSKSILTVVD